MNKKYNAPQAEVIEIEIEGAILVGSTEDNTIMEDPEDFVGGSIFGE